LLRRNLITALQNQGSEITVIAPFDSYTERVRNLGVNVIDLPLRPSGKNVLQELATIRALYTALKSVKPDAVLSYTVKCNLYAGLCQRLLPFKLIPNVSGLGEAFSQQGALQNIIRVLYRASLGRCVKIFFQNEEDLSLCIESRLVKEAVCEVLPGSGVDIHHFSPAQRAPEGARTFLMFGRLLPQKGFGYFIRSAASIRATLGDRARFWILGSPDLERRDSVALLKDIQAAHSKGIIRYIPKTDNVLPIIQESDVVVLPSTYNEGVPRSLLEALACGKPIVTTEWKGCRETVRTGMNGYRIQPHDQDALTIALTHLTECSSEDLLQMGRASRKIAETRFNESHVLDAYLRVLGFPPSTSKEHSSQVTEAA
jgi:glycosyltransferase involved in cell wall biosynthesis